MGSTKRIGKEIIMTTFNLLYWIFQYLNKNNKDVLLKMLENIDNKEMNAPTWLKRELKHAYVEYENAKKK